MLVDCNAVVIPNEYILSGRKVIYLTSNLFTINKKMKIYKTKKYNTYIHLDITTKKPRIYWYHKLLQP